MHGCISTAVHLRLSFSPFLGCFFWIGCCLVINSMWLFSLIFVYGACSQLANHARAFDAASVSPGLNGFFVR